MTTGNGTDVSPSMTNGRNTEREQSYRCRLERLWKYLSVETVLLGYLLPSVLLFTAVQNLALEKACRVNFEYPDAVCDLMVEGKSVNNINCFEYKAKMDEKNVIHLISDRSQVVNETNFLNGTGILPENNPNSYTIVYDVTPLEPEVCEAELRSQILETRLNKYTSFFQLFFPIVLVLYAGAWSDKSGRRKICMLIPMFGELGNVLVLLIATIFFKQLPVQFSSILGVLLRSMTGGGNLLLMGVFSYLSETTAPEDRTVRFGIFVQFFTIISTVFLPFSGHLLVWLGYVKLLLICLPINLLGIYFIVFVMKEPKSDPETQNNMTQIGTGNTSSSPLDEANNQCCLPIYSVIETIFRRRKDRGRAILIFLLFLYFISLGPIFGEPQNEYNFTRLRFNWGSVAYAHYSTFISALELISTTIMITVFKKWLKLADASIGLVSSALSFVTKILIFYTTTTFMFYIVQSIDIFNGLKVLVLKSMISIFVDENEVGRAFSIIAIIEAFSLSAFIYVYSEIYEQTLESWPAAFYFTSLLLLGVCVLCFISLYFILRGNTRYGEAAAQQMGLGNVQEEDQMAIGDTSQVYVIECH